VCANASSQTPCTSGNYCLPGSTAQTPCTPVCAAAGTYQSVACTLTTDRVCSGCSNLKASATYTGVGTTATNCAWV
jgi:hypothetical protein